MYGWTDIRTYDLLTNSAQRIELVKSDSLVNQQMISRKHIYYFDSYGIDLLANNNKTVKLNRTNFSLHWSLDWLHPRADRLNLRVG